MPGILKVVSMRIHLTESSNMPIWMDDDRDAFDEFSDAFGNDCVASFRERYMGQWDSEKDFAEHIVDECYNLDEMMGHQASYFDYEAYAKDLFIDDFYFSNGYVFRR